MIKKLLDGSVDVAAALTEGLVASIANGENGFKIFGTFVESPLCWAISAGVNNEKVTNVDSLRNGRIGISRFGSGSHIMPFVLADQRGWLNDKVEQGNGASPDAPSQASSPFTFEVLKDFKGLRDGVNSGKADAFLWEKFMTKPYHDNKEVQYIDEITPAWPAFLFAARRGVDAAALKEFLEATREGSQEFVRGITDGTSVRTVKEFMEESHVAMLAEKVGSSEKTGAPVDRLRAKNASVFTPTGSPFPSNVALPEETIVQWFKTVRYPPNGAHVHRSELDRCVATLRKAGVITKALPSVESLCDQSVGELVSTT